MERRVATNAAAAGRGRDDPRRYRNEPAVGRALQRVPGGRDRAFLASKLSSREALSYDGARRRVQETLDAFGVESVELYSLHGGFGFADDVAARRDARAAWRALVQFKREGVVAAIGVSNFNARDLRAFAEDPELGGLALPDVVQNKLDA